MNSIDFRQIAFLQRFLPYHAVDWKSIMQEMECTAKLGYDRDFFGVPDDAQPAQSTPVFARRTTTRGAGWRPGLTGLPVIFKDQARLRNQDYNVLMHHRKNEASVSGSFEERSTIREESSVINPKKAETCGSRDM